MRSSRKAARPTRNPLKAIGTAVIAQMNSVYSIGRAPCTTGSPMNTEMAAAADAASYRRCRRRAVSVSAPSTSRASPNMLPTAIRPPPRNSRRPRSGQCAADVTPYSRRPSRFQLHARLISRSAAVSLTRSHRPAVTTAARTTTDTSIETGTVFIAADSRAWDEPPPTLAKPLGKRPAHHPAVSSKARLTYADLGSVESSGITRCREVRQ